MSHFLLIYDRNSGTLLKNDQFKTSAEALKARFRAEDEYADRSEIEVVALSASSEADLRRTHSRYFLGLDELTSQIS
ncbi:MAG TPA: hypothetical protein VMF31_02400 [Solirubrobacterales bacterium]|nr:hypothetical protein [Solirubrobacterales bacterium]